MIVQHLRRPVLRPDEGWCLIRCECGWEGRTPGMNRTPDSIDAELEQVYRRHLSADEARTHLWVDARVPRDNLTLDQWLERAANNRLTEDQARAAFASQPTIIGTFVMPIGEPVTLIAERYDDGVHHGTYRTHAGIEAELPIGEVTTAAGQVFRLNE